MTNNKAILTVLKTKAADLDKIKGNKLSAYMEVVAMDFEIVVDADESVQGYVTIKNRRTGRELVISQGYDNKTLVFGNGRAFEGDRPFNELVKVIDFYGYLTKPIYPRYRQPQAKVERYKELKWSLDLRERMEKQYQAEYDTAKYNLDRSRQYKEAVIQELKEMKK